MNTNTNKPQKTEEVADALSGIAENGEQGSDWEVFHDPATGQMKFVRRGDPTAQPQPGSVPVTTIAASGFAAIA